MSNPLAGIDTQASQNVPSTWRVANVADIDTKLLLGG